ARRRADPPAARASGLLRLLRRGGPRGVATLARPVRRRRRRALPALAVRSISPREPLRAPRPRPMGSVTGSDASRRGSDGGVVDEVDEIVQEFLVESYENLDQLDQDLVALESQPGSRELLSSIFRTIHTIK